MRVRVCAGGAARAHAPRAGGLGAGRVGARGGGAGLARAPQQDAGRAHQDTRRTQDRRSVTTFIFDWYFFMFVTSLRLNAPILFIRMLVLPVSYFDLIQFLKSFFVLIFVFLVTTAAETRAVVRRTALVSQAREPEAPSNFILLYL